MTDQKLVSLAELADRTGLPMAWLRRESDAGRIPAIRAGRRRYFDFDAVRHVLGERVRDTRVSPPSGGVEQDGGAA